MPPNIRGSGLALPIGRQSLRLIVSRHAGWRSPSLCGNILERGCYYAGHDRQRKLVTPNSAPAARAVAQIKVLKAAFAAHVPSKIDGTCAALRRV